MKFTTGEPKCLASPLSQGRKLELHDYDYRLSSPYVSVIDKIPKSLHRTNSSPFKNVLLLKWARLDNIHLYSVQICEYSSQF